MRFGYDLREILENKQKETTIPASIVSVLQHLIKNIEDIQSVIDKSGFNKSTSVFNSSINGL